MLIPSIFRENLFDDFFGNDFCRPARREPNAPVFHPAGVMKTDVKESDEGYDITVDLPGYAKENVKAELKNGVLTVSAEVNTENEQKDDEDRYVRRERYSGSCSRSFYVGEEVENEDIKAKFDNGTLAIFVPKKQPEVKPEISTNITIE